MKINEKNWWQKLFDQKYLDTYLLDLTPERTSQEIDFIIKAVKLKPQDRILDLACGHGRHAIELAKRGFERIVGLDYSKPFIKKAVADSKQAGVSVDFLVGDMRSLPFHQEFDVVLHLFTAFGYFDDQGNQEVLDQISQTLKPGGRYLLDVVSGEAVVKRFREKGEKETGTNLFKISREKEMGGKSVDETEWYDPEKQLIHTHRQWREKGRRKEYDYYLRVYTVPQYKEMLNKAGLELERLWSSFEMSPQNPKLNWRTIILARKSQSPGLTYLRQARPACRQVGVALRV